MDQKLDDRTLVGRMETPLGWIELLLDHTHILSLHFVNGHTKNTNLIVENQLFKEIERQIDAYFSGKLHSFDLPLAPKGTVFQKNVWEKLLAIPYGKVCSYAEIAVKMGGKEKTRSVASAIAKNPILILIPCHRVIGSNGKLTGFSGGIDKKKALLDLEGNIIDF